MQKQSSSKGTFITLAIIGLVALGLFFYFAGDPSNDPMSALETTEVADAQIVGSRVLGLLNRINSLQIDKTIFESAAYMSLVDYTITIPEQPVGRENPFAPR